jgi:tRNA1Val (adenine37-N6)-methyltransferase
MPNQYFRFKQFTVNQDRCAMKVGTDGVLLGSWVDVEKARRVLDIGTGTGLLALMVAQRNEHAFVHALEIDSDAATQAGENARESAWGDRITVIQGDFLAQSFDGEYDLIICNPPYFTQSLKSPDKQRTAARHSDSLPLDRLAKGVSDVLADDGVFAVVLPLQEGDALVNECRECGLEIKRKAYVYAKTDSQTPKRVLLEFSKKSAETIEERIVIEKSERHDYTDQYKALTKDFYLKF